MSIFVTGDCHGRFSNNFVDYFTYFIDLNKTFEINSTPTFATKLCGLVEENVFQYMMNMIEIGIVIRGDFIRNLFDRFCKDVIYKDLDNTNFGPFPIATCLCELQDE